LSQYQNTYHQNQESLLKASQQFRVSIGLVTSDNSDYSDPSVRTTLSNYTGTADAVEVYRLNIDSGVAYTFTPASRIETVDFIIIKNRDTANGVKVDYTTATGGTTTTAGATGHNIAAGRFMVIPDCDPDSTVSIIAATADVDIDLILVGTSNN